MVGYTVAQFSLSNTQEKHTYVFGELELRLRVSISLTLHGDSVSLFDVICVFKGKGGFL